MKLREQIKIFFFILFCLHGNLLPGQNQLVKKWDYRYGGTDYDYLSCIQQTIDGGYLLAGHTASGIGGDKSESCWGVNDFWVVKTDSLGIKQWDKRFGGTLDEELFSVAQTADKGFILGGYTGSDSTGDVSQHSIGYNDYWIVKTDSLGNKEWDKRYGGTVANQLMSLKQTTDGGYILGGWSNSGIGGNKSQSCRGLKDFWIVKTDSLGNQQWDKRFGGTSDDQLTSLEQTNDGGYILGGWSSSGAGGDKTQPLWGSMDYWIVKIDSAGTKQWDKRFGGTSTEILSSIIQIADGGYILFGRSFSGISGDKTQPAFGQNDYWILKIDSLGIKQWDKTFGGSDLEDMTGTLVQTADGGFLLSGSSYSPLGGSKSENNLGIEQSWIIKTDQAGNKKWDKTIFTNAHDEVGYAIQSSDGCYVFANYTDGGNQGYKTQASQGASDYWIVKFCDTASYLPTAGFVASTTSFCDKQCIDFYDASQNNPTSWQWFFPGSDSATSILQNPVNICYDSVGSFDVTLIVCNALSCDTLLMTGFINEYPSLTVNIYMSNDTLIAPPGYSYQWYGIHAGPIPGATSNFFVPIQNDAYYVQATNNPGCNAFSNSIDITNTSVSEYSEMNEGFLIYPNPNDGYFSIIQKGTGKNSFTLNIFNSFGKQINFRCTFIGCEKINIELDDHLNGIYLAEIIYGNEIIRRKIIISSSK